MISCPVIPPLISKMTVSAISSGDTSSRAVRTKDYWEDFKTINEGKLAGWILDREESVMILKAFMKRKETSLCF